jgi:hypothetical protein
MALTARQRKIGIAGVVAMCAAVAGGFLIGLIPHYLAAAVRGFLAMMVLAGVFLAMVPRWRMLDHMQQDSRLAGWYWGGSFGGAVGLVLAILVVGVRSPLFTGAALLWLFQFTGYSAARLHWWFAHRSGVA